MSHFACADEPGHPLNARQIEVFEALKACFPGVEASLANSAGIHLGSPPTMISPVRASALYGGNPVAAPVRPDAPVVTAEARMLQIRQAKAGQPVSYGAAHILSRDSRIAVCGIGYADGFLRSGSGTGVPLSATPAGRLRARSTASRVPVIGKITMDLTMFDVTDLPEDDVRRGRLDRAVRPTISLEEAALAAGTISYEMLTSLGSRYAPG
jgi:alanine racemase